jgi:hypothetical protein
VLVGAAVCPHPPLLVPQATGGAGGAVPVAGPHDQASRAVDAQLSELRSACHAAVADLTAAGPELIVVAGGADRTETFDGSAAGSLRDFGVPFVTGCGPPVLPLSLTIGAWLIRGLPAVKPGADPPWRLRFQAVGRSLPAAECLRIGAALARQAPRVALLAMGDGPARPATGAPGAPDPQAAGYAATVAAALAGADPGMLAGIDPALDGELLVAGRSAWQVLAGAALGHRFTGRLRYASAPLDVSYLVACWTPVSDVARDRPVAECRGRGRPGRRGAVSPDGV